MWKMWYVAGANQDDYLVQGYAESPDGRFNWSPHRMVFPAEERVFDFAVIPVENGFEAVYAHVNVSKADLPKTGLWWCRAKEPSPNIADWSEPVRLTDPGPWKPVPRYDDAHPNRLFVFYDGAYTDAAGRGFNFTLNCLEIDRPR